jgi:type IV secretory pathway TraG/TraD family ATPase VirD4
MRTGVSDGAIFQSYQTRARLSAKLYFNIARATLLIWVLFNIWLVWYETGRYFPQVAHQYFWRWVICSTLMRIPLVNTLVLRCLIPANGVWYPVGPLTDWMNSGQMYRLSFPTWWWHYARWTALIPVGLAAVAIVWRGRRRLDLEHIRGLQLLTTRAHNRELNGNRLVRAWHQNDGIRIGASIIPRNRECEHILISGGTGSGKTTAKRHLLSQIQERKEPAVVVDVESEFVQEFYNEARGDVILNPLDARCPFWNCWSECRPDFFDVDTEALAASLIRGPVRNANEEFFRDSARTLMESLLEVVKDRDDATGLYNAFTLPRDELQKRLAGTAAYVLIDPDASEQGVGILSVARNAIKPFRYLPRRNETDRTWSAREWAQTRKGWIFLCSQESARAAILRQQALWLDCLIRWLVDCDIDSQKTWIVIDELPAMGYQPTLAETLLPRSRKRGIACVLGFQNVSQLRALYGRDMAVSITSSPSVKCFFRSDEIETAEWVADMLGKHEIERLQMTQLAGLSNMREGVNLQPNRVSEHLVTADEIKLLPTFCGYLTVAGADRTSIRIKERHLERRHPAFIPRLPKVIAAPAKAADKAVTPPTEKAQAGSYYS